MAISATAVTQAFPKEALENRLKSDPASGADLDFAPDLFRLLRFSRASLTNRQLSWRLASWDSVCFRVELYSADGRANMMPLGFQFILSA